MTRILFSSQLSRLSTPSTLSTPVEVTVIPHGEEEPIFRNVYDSPFPVRLAGINRVVEEDMRRRGGTQWRYSICGEEVEVLYRSLPDDGTDALEYARRNFLCAGRVLTFPAVHTEDIKIPIYTEGAEVCHIKQIWTVGGEVKTATMSYPVAAGGDEITIHTDQLLGRPCTIIFTCGERRLIAYFPTDCDPMTVAGAPDRMHTAIFRYRDPFGMFAYLFLPAIRSHSPQVEKVTATVNSRFMQLRATDKSTVTLTVEGLPYRRALDVMSLLMADNTRVWTRDPETGEMRGEDVVVTEVSGDISDDPTKLNTLRVTYRRQVG